MKWREQIKEILDKAEKDMVAVEELMKSQRVSSDIIGFHVQQAIEKLLKVLLAANGIQYRKTHDIRELIDLLEDNGIKVPQTLSDLDEFTPYAIEYRYEDMSYEMEEIDINRSFQKIKELNIWVRKQL